MILESFTNTPHKTIHVISLPKHKIVQKKYFNFLVGRENTVDIRITDISVSRAHAHINYYNGQFYLTDNDSKFGTLVLLKNPTKIPYLRKYNNPFNVTVQLGKCLMTLTPEYKERKCCGSNTFTEYTLPLRKTYDDYIGYYPYMLSIKIDAISKFEDIQNNEIIHKRHKRKTKSPRKIRPSMDHELAPKELQRSATLELNQNSMVIPKTSREESKYEDRLHMNNRDLDNLRMSNKNTLYASTDLRTSIEPNLNMSRKNNNFVTDEHISITHRPMNSIDTNPLTGRLPSIAPQNRHLGILKDPEVYRVHDPNSIHDTISDKPVSRYQEVVEMIPNRLSIDQSEMSNSQMTLVNNPKNSQFEKLDSMQSMNMSNKHLKNTHITKLPHHESKFASGLIK